MNPMAKARGVQRARNDTAATSGGMPAARQRRTPAACAAADAWVRTSGLNPSGDVAHCTLATVPAMHPPHGQFSRCGAVEPFAPPQRSACAHRQGTT